MSRRVSLVIPGRNCAGTLAACLDAATAIMNTTDSPPAAADLRLEEIIFVDDASTDDTGAIAARYPVTVLRALGLGPGAARNIGWRAARGDLVWFIDSDCVPEPDALAKLLPHLADPGVAAAGGSYGNRVPDSLLGCLIHEEIVERHHNMPASVNFLGGFNALYRRSALEQVGGFDEHRFNGPGLPGAEDAELAYRVHAAGHQLRFERSSRVGHFHPTHIGRYLRAQRRHGYWRVFLHIAHPHRAGGDAYSGLVDHLQPILAVLSIAACAAALAGRALQSGDVTAMGWTATLLAGSVAVLQLPMTRRLVRRTGAMRYLAFAPLGFLRAYLRGIGMVQGMICYPFRGRPRREQPTDATPP